MIEEKEEEQMPDCPLFLNLSNVLQTNKQTNKQTKAMSMFDIERVLTKYVRPVSAELFALAIWISVCIRR
jgi:hypothetical protein